MENIKGKKQCSIHSFIVCLYWKTFGKRAINKTVKDALNEPLPDMTGIRIGELRENGGYYNSERVI